jgi:hypothetical protein
MNRATLISLSLAVSTVALAETAAKVTAEREAHVTQADLKWVQPFGPKGPSLSFVEGTFGDKHPASFFVKMPAGADSGWHLHDETYNAIVIQGTFTEQQQGDAAETTLPIGSYFTQPGKRAHRNGCLVGSECLVFVHFDKGASSTPTTPDGKPIKLPAKK